MKTGRLIRGIKEIRSFVREANKRTSPNQVLTHAARAAASQLNKLRSRARRARRALVRATSGQQVGYCHADA